MHAVDAYAHQVVSGELPAGKYHRLPCQRHLDDRAREGSPDFPYQFDPAHADRFFRFASQLKHYKGKAFAGKPITFTPVQQFRLGSIFGWRRTDNGLRRFTTAYNELPRGSGKTLEAAVVALYVTFFEGEPGAEGYCIATKRQQAKLAFDAARKLVQSSGLKGRIGILTHNLHREAQSQKLEALGADADSTDGLNPYLIITDEFHAHKTRDLIDVMESATGKRLSFLHYQITTAGDDEVSPCGDQHRYITQILEGVIRDTSTESTFGFIAHADPEDDWQDERTWIKANPHWGISVNPEDMRKLAQKAMHMPAAAAEFQQKRLNRWINASAPWLSLDGWRKGQSSMPQADFEWQLARRRCWVGVDLSSKIDITAVVALFEPTEDDPRWKLLMRAFTPADTMDERAHKDRAPYGQWVEQGWLSTTPGNRIDQGAVREVIGAFADAYEVREIGFDPWNAANLVAELREDGFTEEQVLEIPQTFLHLSGASKDFEADVLDGHLDANSNPLLAWMVSNAVVQRDGKDNIQPIKKKSRGRIDGVVAAVMARKLAGRSEPSGDKVYFYELGT